MKTVVAFFLLLSFSSCQSMAQKKEFIGKQLDKMRAYRDWEAKTKHLLPASCMPAYQEQRKQLTDIIHDQGVFIIGSDMEKK